MLDAGARHVVAHLSDLHLGAHDPAAVASVVDDVAAVAPTLTVVTGDLTMRARAGQFRRAREFLDRLPGPLLVVAGNHDVPLVSVERVLAPYRRYQRLILPELDPVLRLPGLTALGLQTTPRWRWKSGRVSRRQSEAVVSVLGSAPAGAVRLLALHHPPRATGLERLVGRDRLLRALARARVDLVLAGHTHVFRTGRMELGATAHRPIEVVAGTAVSRRTRGTGRSWTVIRVDASAVVVEERRQSGTGWRTGTVRRFPRAG
ncbi:metallophosphoesterase [Actinoplanes sp. NPDC049316]|uniref:metallophosphoesterase family protein n=1 Tax=Actinoplanes sp. NPDC049316 TaxID=3154727 RepID=UPI00343E5467